MVRSAVVGAPMTETKAHAADTPDLPRPTKPDFAPVIRSKVQPPALRADTLTRERLAKRLDEALASRVVLVVADAGYGKTTMLADYAARSGFRTLWYRLSASDSDSVTWANYLVAACREVDPSFGATTTSLLASSSAGRLPQDAYIQSFLGELSRWHEAPTLLVLDDYHEIDNNLEVSEIVGRLIEDAPTWLHLVISARRRPHLSFGKLAAAAELSELRTDELRFTAAETQRLFAEGYSQPLGEEVVKQLDRRTRGWAASLQLFHSSIRGRQPAEVARLADSLSGASGPLYDYLAEEVLANVPDDLAEFLVRASVLEPIVPEYVPTLFSLDPGPAGAQIKKWIEEASRLGLLHVSAAQKDSFEFHPLLRDFLRRQLEERKEQSDVRDIHLRLGRALADYDPLRACSHLIEAGRPEEAMELLGSSVLGTLGSGQWGAASALLDRLRNVAAGPAVAAIRARHLTSNGDSAGAARLLLGIDLGSCSADVRAVVRQTWFSIGWRTGDRELLRTTVRDILGDPETPHILREFAEFFVDAGATRTDGVDSLPRLARRLVDMAESHKRGGRPFFSGISFHNAAVTYLNAANYPEALRAGEAALESFQQLGFQPAEETSTYSVLSTVLFELGRVDEAHRCAGLALSGNELADVPAELAVLYAALGSRGRALEYLARAEALVREGRTDIGAIPLVDSARAELALPDDPLKAVELLADATDDWPLDLGQALHRRTQLAEAYFLAGDRAACLTVAEPALVDAGHTLARRAEVRLALLVSLAAGNAESVDKSLAEASSTSRLALDELADVICQSGHLVSLKTDPITTAIVARPERWLVALRRQLHRGAPEGLPAASVLDQYGEVEDVSRLRAFAKTYRRRGASA